MEIRGLLSSLKLQQVHRGCMLKLCLSIADTGFAQSHIWTLADPVSAVPVVTGIPGSVSTSFALRSSLSQQCAVFLLFPLV